MGDSIFNEDYASPRPLFSNLSWYTYYHYCPEYGENMKLNPDNKQGSRVGRQTKTMWTFLDGWTWVSNFLLSSLSSAKIFCFRAKHNHSAKRDLSVVNNCGAKCQMSWEQLAPHLFWYFWHYDVAYCQVSVITICPLPVPNIKRYCLRFPKKLKELSTDVAICQVTGE